MLPKQTKGTLIPALQGWAFLLRWFKNN